ncbi:MAG: serine O-acetyltransferase [Fusobacteriaceae bacterium]|nr:serine O-acetyltransferase [Fusobacteriaceae bacterium]
MKKNIQNDLNNLVTIIAESYKNYGLISHLDCDVIPQRNEIIDIVLKFREILFPGYFCEESCNIMPIEDTLNDRLNIIFEKLHNQIYKSLCLYFCKNTPGENNGLLESAREKTLVILNRIPYIREILATDVQAAYDGDPAASSTDEIIFSYPGIFAIMTHRIAHELYLLSIPLVPRIMSEYAHNLTGIDINPGAKIGKYFFIDHGTGIVIGETTEIGEHVRIYQGVTLGALSLKDANSLRGAKRHPTLKDGVVVYSGASILGGNTVIEEGVIIGSNVFITHSVGKKTSISVKNQDLHYSNKEDEKPNGEIDAFIDWVI